MDQLRLQFPADNFTLLAVILLLPLVGAFVCGVFGQRLGKQGVRAMALSAVSGSFVACLIAFSLLSSAPEAAGGEHGAAAGAAHAATRFTWNAWRWLSVDGGMHGTIPVPIDVSFSIDQLSGVMMLVVTGIGFLIHVYSTEYMKKDEGYYRFFAYLNLFIFSMLVLILGDNLAVLFVGWEGVGLCSYLLIGFWFSDETKAAAGKKAFITNRIGDFGLLVAMAMLVCYARTLRFADLERTIDALAVPHQIWPLPNVQMPDWLPDFITRKGELPWQATMPTMVAIALFIGCIGKSAQIPLYVWLPDAMAGPTPVSALIHAATMVTAGVYLVARTSFIFALSPLAMTIVAGTGALTALLAASIAFAQNDLKKVLAYSTVSQLGYMFMGVGSGAFAAGFFHVVTHAFFKGCLFLCAGSVIHAMHHTLHDENGSQDMRNMGGLAKYMPVTHWTFLISCLAIAGFPLTSGFFSKDEVLFEAFRNGVVGADKQWLPPAWFGQAVYVAGMLGAVGTAFYMFRAYFMTFWGDFRGWKIVKRKQQQKSDHEHEHGHGRGPLEGVKPHESPWPMTAPLAILAFFAAVGGFLYIGPHGLEHFWQPVFATASRSIVRRAGTGELEFPLQVAGASACFVGVAAAFWVYVHKEGKPAAAFVGAVPRLHKLVFDKWRIDELYDATILGFVDALGDTAASMDKWLIDGVIARLTAGVTQVAGAALRMLQTGRVQVYAAGMVLGVAGVGWFVLFPHAVAEIDASRLRAGGELSLTAAPGHGYSYRWYEDDPTKFTEAAQYSLKLDRCQTKTVHLEVRGVFGTSAVRAFTQCREMGNDCCSRVAAAGSATVQAGAPPDPSGRGTKPAIRRLGPEDVDGGR